MVAEVTQKINDIVSKHLAPALKQQGFKRAGQRFRKQVDEVIWVVDVQRDKYNVGDEGSFTINLGVYHPAWIAVTQEVERARRFLAALTEAPASYDCLITERLDFLAARPNDWWKVDAQASAGELGPVVVAALLEHGLPWLTRMSPLEHAVADLTARYIGFKGAWSYKTMAMFGWVALGRLDQAAKLYMAASGDVISHEEQEREFGPWARARGIPVAWECGS